MIAMLYVDKEIGFGTILFSCLCCLLGSSETWGLLFNRVNPFPFSRAQGDIVENMRMQWGFNNFERKHLCKQGV